MARVGTMASLGLFGATVLAALAFGASQAVASPRTPERAAWVCTDDRCNGLCVRNGYDNGYCMGNDCICS